MQQKPGRSDAREPRTRGCGSAFSPGFRWGTTLLPGQTITRENLMEQTAITYPDASVGAMTGADIHKRSETLNDKLFNDDPYQHQGGDMVRTGGLTFACEPGAAKGARISDMRLNGRPVEAGKTYKVARWGVGAPRSPSKGTPVWDIVEQYLRQPAATHTPNVPRLIRVDNNPGIAVEGVSPA